MVLIILGVCRSIGVHANVNDRFFPFLTSGMADFQYLASHSDPEGNQVSLYDKIILRKPEKKEFYDNPVPLFIPPPIFSRLDMPVDYFYRPDVMHK